ncbi:hypothetical protein A2U01_0028960, partial [Trifolium medium]|nr:hypothetical protein [Trifolium medium]
AGGRESSSTRRRYARRAEFDAKFVGHTSFSLILDISFTKEDEKGVMPHDDDPLVIQVQILNCDVKRVLIDSGSSADIMYWEAFKAMQLLDEQLMPHNGALIGFAGEQVEVIGHTTLLTTFGEGENTKMIKVRYLVVKTPFTSYNIIIGRPTFNALGTVMSTLYLFIKYPLDNGKVGTVRGDQPLARRCYESSLKIRHKTQSGNASPHVGTREKGINMISSTDLDPREEFYDRRVSPIEDLEQVQIRKEVHQVTNLGSAMHQSQ